jgi:DNA-binding LytR/AlgR family response regulator
MLLPFFVWHNKVLKKIKTEEVVYLTTEGNYTRIYLSNKTSIIMRATLSGALQQLPSDVFIKVHRRFVASIFYIDTIDKDHLIIAGKPMPVGRQYYKTFINQLNIIDKPEA